jgi:hypothetical protein
MTFFLIRKVLVALLLDHLRYSEGEQAKTATFRLKDQALRDLRSQ